MLTKLKILVASFLLVGLFSPIFAGQPETLKIAIRNKASSIELYSLSLGPGSTMSNCRLVWDAPVINCEVQNLRGVKATLSFIDNKSGDTCSVTYNGQRPRGPRIQSNCKNLGKSKYRHNLVPVFGNVKVLRIFFN